MGEEKDEKVINLKDVTGYVMRHESGAEIECTELYVPFWKKRGFKVVETKTGFAPV